MLKFFFGLALGACALAATPSLADDGCGGNGCHSARGKGALVANVANVGGECGGNGGCHSARGKGVLADNAAR